MFGSLQAEVKKALEKVCSLMPDTVREECAGFVQQYSQVIINLLVQGLDPAKVCTAVKLCTATELRAILTGILTCMVFHDLLRYLLYMDINSGSPHFNS